MPKHEEPIFADLRDNEAYFRHRYGESGDVLLRRMKAGRYDCLLLWCDGMTSHMLCYEVLFRRVYELGRERLRTPKQIFAALSGGSDRLYDSEVCTTLGEVGDKILSGCAVFLLDGVPKAISVSAQGFNTRSISESYTEENVRASREGFVESVKVNMTLIRRRIKSDRLVFRYFKCGTVSNTDAMLVYLRDRVSPALVRSIEKKIAGAPVELMLESGFAQPFLNDRRLSLFSSCGYTERPDTLCGKMLEGRVGVLIDGSPFALVVPYLFAENFQCIDDYTGKALYASMMRCVKIAAFFLSFLLPGVYLAVAGFHPQALSSDLLLTLAAAQSSTPFSMLGEGLLINLLYEIVREAGLRLPRPVGHAVSLIGALVIGDAAVRAGLIGNPMLVAVAFTALCSFTVPALYQVSALLRFAFLLLGGLFGIPGLGIGLAAVLLDICGGESFGVPYAAPFSPYSGAAARDGFWRRTWLDLAGKSSPLYNLRGAHRHE